MTEEELEHLHSQLPGLPVGWEVAVSDLIDEVRRLRIASLGLFDPIKVGQVVAQLQMERDEARRERDEAQVEAFSLRGEVAQLHREVKKVVETAMQIANEERARADQLREELAESRKIAHCGRCLADD